jgi:hypothetical protein
MYGVVINHTMRHVMMAGWNATEVLYSGVENFGRMRELNTMRKQARFLFYLWLVGGLAACVLPAPLNPVLPDQNPAQEYETVSVLLTGTAEIPGELADPVLLSTSTSAAPLKTATLAPQQEGTPLPTTTIQVAAKSSTLPAATRPCDLAQPGRPIDITVPDDSHFQPGAYFAKTWRLVNAGTCPWAEDYAVVWFSGDDLGVNHEQLLGALVQPGKSVDVTVDMTAPQDAGTYQSNWKMRSAEGSLFGIGPNGDAPFWVRIVVVPEDTPTPEPTELPLPTQTDAPLVLLQDSRVLLIDEGLELDPSSSLDPLEDIVFQRSEQGPLLAPINGARLVLMTDALPAYDLCRLAPLSEEDIYLEDLAPGVSLCYSTSTGLPGRVQLVEFDPQGNEISLVFLTWAVR